MPGRSGQRDGIMFVPRAVGAAVVVESHLRERNAAAAEAAFEPFRDNPAEHVGVDLRDERLQGVHHGFGHSAGTIYRAYHRRLTGRAAGDRQPEGVLGNPAVVRPRPVRSQPRDRHGQQVEPVEHLGHVDVAADYHRLRAARGGGHVHEQQHGRIGGLLTVDRDAPERDYAGFRAFGDISFGRIVHSVVGEEAVGAAGPEMRQRVEQTAETHVECPGLPDKGEVGETLLSRVDHNIIPEPVGEGARLYLIRHAELRHHLC